MVKIEFFANCIYHDVEVKKLLFSTIGSNRTLVGSFSFCNFCKYSLWLYKNSVGRRKFSGGNYKTPNGPLFKYFFHSNISHGPSQTPHKWVLQQYLIFANCIHHDVQQKNFIIRFLIYTFHMIYSSWKPPKIEFLQLPILSLLYSKNMSKLE